MHDPGAAAAIERYLKKSRSIPGWLRAEDARLTLALDAIQKRAGLTGDMLEIGVYLGRSAILFGFLRAPGERLVVCDLFESPPRPKRGEIAIERHFVNLAQPVFEANYLKFHPELPVVLRCSSTRLLPEGLVAPPFRIVHVDGSHDHAIVTQDVATARTLLPDGGLAIFDDFRGIRNSRVAPAVWDAMEAGRFRPLCMTPEKLFTCAGPDLHGLGPALEDWARGREDMEAERRSIAGHDALLIHPLPRRRGPEVRLERKSRR